MFRWFGVALMSLGLAACGGGGKPPIELTIDFDPAFSTPFATLVIHGETFIPEGSVCPASNEYVIFGTLGPSTVTVRNATTGRDTPGAVHSLWVCNAGSDTVSWASNPITLNPGPNVLTVTMTDRRRSSSATVTVTRTVP